MIPESVKAWVEQVRALTQPDALAAVEEAERRMGARPKVYPHPYAALRKMAQSR